MQVGLFAPGGAQITYTFAPPPDNKWGKQGQGTAHLIGLDTGLSGTLAKVFVKRWNKVEAPAHDLLMQTVAKPLPNTPGVLGHGMDDQGHYYFFADISVKHGLLDNMMSGANGSVLKRILQDESFAPMLCASASEFLQAVNDRGYVYPDFTHKNIMVSGAKSCMFIDADSCFPVDQLESNMRDSGRFAMIYWGVWREIVGARTAKVLSQTMVLSFAVVWARAVAMVRREAAIDDIQNAVRQPNFDRVQAPFWHALEKGSTADLAAYFGIAENRRAKSVFRDWEKLLADLRKGKGEWGQVVTAANAILGLGRDAKLATAGTEPSPAASPATSPRRPASTSRQPRAAPLSASVPPIRLPRLDTIFAGIAALVVGCVLLALFMNRAPTGQEIPQPPTPTPTPTPKQTYPTSFDCARASNRAEREICSSESLAQLDLQLADLFIEKMSQSDPAQKEELRSAQSEWIRQRNSCQNDAGGGTCLADAYNQRLQELHLWPPAAIAIEPRPSPPPAQKEAPPVIAPPSVDPSPAQLPPGMVTCILPSGQETVLAYALCRQQGGVVY